MSDADRSEARDRPPLSRFEATVWVARFSLFSLALSACGSNAPNTASAQGAPDAAGGAATDGPLTSFIGAETGTGVDASRAEAGTGVDASRPPMEAGAGPTGPQGDATPPELDAADRSDAGASSAADTPIYGVTADDITNLSGLVDSLQSLPHKPTTRIVFDDGQAPSHYAQAVPAVHAVSYVMGEILDSSAVAGVSVAAYTTRTSDYLAAFPTTVDIWEIGNEINGNWLDTTPGGAADVAAKMTGAFDLVVAAGRKTALTLYGCSDSGSSHDMMVWTMAHVPARMLAGLDYVLISYYEGDCGAPRSDWPAVFHQLRQLFPKARLGFGEVGSVDANGNDLTNASVAGPYLQRYYQMSISEPGYIGGYFWWYFYEDMVPKTKPLFGILSTAIR